MCYYSHFVRKWWAILNWFHVVFQKTDYDNFPYPHFIKISKSNTNNGTRFIHHLHYARLVQQCVRSTVGIPHSTGRFDSHSKSPCHENGFNWIQTETHTQKLLHLVIIVPFLSDYNVFRSDDNINEGKHRKQYIGAHCNDDNNLVGIECSLFFCELKGRKIARYF